MTRRAHPAVLLLLLAACSREPTTVAPPPMAGPVPAPHPVRRASHEVQTAIGEVKAVDGASGTMTVAIVSGALQERMGVGRVERLRATSQLRSQVRVGEVIEFKFRNSTAMPEMLSVNRHVHHEPLGLPQDLH